MQVLDKGRVELLDAMGTDLRVVEAARVSNVGFNQDGTARTPEQDRKLIRYLLKNQHWSPFEHCVMTFQVKLPIFVARQWMRHRSWSFNEISARYAELEDDFYVPELGRIQRQSTSNKQASGEAFAEDDATQLQGFISEYLKNSHKAYSALLVSGLARELARTVMSVGTYTEMYATCNLRSFLHFVTLRDHPHAQFEIAEYARAMYTQVSKRFPVTCEEWTALNEAQEG